MKIMWRILIYMHVVEKIIHKLDEYDEHQKQFFASGEWHGRNYEIEKELLGLIRTMK